MSRHNVKPRRPRDMYHNDKDLTPHQNLAAAILMTAVRDAKKVKKDGPFQQNGIPVSENELRIFFRSSWGGTLLGSAGLTEETMIRRLGL